MDPDGFEPDNSVEQPTDLRPVSQERPETQERPVTRDGRSRGKYQDDKVSSSADSTAANDLSLSAMTGEADPGEDPFPPGPGPLAGEDASASEEEIPPYRIAEEEGELSPMGSTGEKQRWGQSTCEDSMRLTSSILQSARQELWQNDRAIERVAQTGARKGINILLQSKMQVTFDMTRGLEDRHISVEDSCRQMGECLFQLRRAYRAKWAALNVCERRLELRDHRPLQELNRDHLQASLENERQTLIEARQELQEHIAKTVEMVSALEGAKRAIMEDLHQKRQSMRVDRSCLMHKPGTAGKKERTILPSLHEVSHYTAPQTASGSPSGGGAAKEAVDGKDTRALIARVVHLEENAMILMNDNDAAMLTTKQECDQASRRSRVALDNRVEQLEDIRRRLEAQLGETSETMEAAEMSLLKTKKQLDGQEGPRKKLDRQYAARATASKGVREPVDDALDQQLETLKKSITTLTSKWNSSKDILDRLQQSKQQLLEELRIKNAAWKIENDCRKLTSRKAIEMDRADPCAGRCLVQGQKRSAGRRPLKAA